VGFVNDDTDDVVIESLIAEELLKAAFRPHQLLRIDDDDSISK